MTRRDVAQRLWDFINSGPAISSGVFAENAESRSILESCNAAMQEIAHYAPRNFFKQTRSSVLKAPVSGTIDVTEDSKSFNNLIEYSATGAQTNQGGVVNTRILISDHTLVVGDKIKFTTNVPADLNSQTVYYVVLASNDTSTSTGSYISVSTVANGTAIAVTQTATGIGYNKLINSVTNGSTIEIAGAEGLMRLGSVVDESLQSNVYISGSAETADISLKDLGEPTSYQHDFKVDDGIAFVDAAPESGTILRTGSDAFTNASHANKLFIPNHNATVNDPIAFSTAPTGLSTGDFSSGTTYYVIEVGTDGTHGNFVKLSTSAGGSVQTLSGTQTGITYTLKETFIPKKGITYFIHSIGSLTGGVSSDLSQSIEVKTAVSGGHKIYFTATSARNYKIIRTTFESGGSFLEEYIGSTGTKSCTVYNDSVKLNSKVTEVLGTVVLNDEEVLTPLQNEDQSARHHHKDLHDIEEYRGRVYDYNIPSELKEKSGTPAYYYVTTEHNDAEDKQNYYLRVRPLPSVKARIRFTANILPEKWVGTDIISSSGHSKTTGCPAEYDETVLMPFIYKNFTKFIGFDVLPSEGSLQSGNILLQIDEDYKQAIEILKGLEPQSERNAGYGIVY